MTQATESSLPKSVLVAGGLQSIIQSSNAVRYLIFTDSANDRRVQSVNVAVFGTGRETIRETPRAMFLFETSIGFGDGYSMHASRTNFEVKAAADVVGKLSEWEGKTLTHPWWGTWVSAAPFVATLVFMQGRQVRDLPQKHPVLSYYHGIVAQQMFSHLKQMEELFMKVDTLRPLVHGLSAMARRFEAMANQAQQNVFEHSLGLPT